MQHKSNNDNTDQKNHNSSICFVSFFYLSLYIYLLSILHVYKLKMTSCIVRTKCSWLIGYYHLSKVLNLQTCHIPTTQGKTKIVAYNLKDTENKNVAYKQRVTEIKLNPLSILISFYIFCLTTKFKLQKRASKLSKMQKHPTFHRHEAFHMIGDSEIYILLTI